MSLSSSANINDKKKTENNRFGNEKQRRVITTTARRHTHTTPRTAYVKRPWDENCSAQMFGQPERDHRARARNMNKIAYEPWWSYMCVIKSTNIWCLLMMTSFYIFTNFSLPKPCVAARVYVSSLSFSLARILRANIL